MAAQGDVVFMIGGDSSGLMQAGKSGEQSLAQMERAAKELERSIGKVGQAGVAFQRELNGLTGVTREFSKSARDSAAAFDAFDKSRAQVDNQRMHELMARFDGFQGRVDQLEAQLEAATLGQNPSLEAQFRELELNDEIERELARLKGQKAEA